MKRTYPVKADLPAFKLIQHGDNGQIGEFVRSNSPSVTAIGNLPVPENR